jgi:hypothetical protein
MIKTKTFLFLIKYQDMKTSGGAGVYFLEILIQVLNIGKWLGLHSSSNNSGETAPDTHWAGDWVDPRADVDAMEVHVTDI